MSFPTVVFQGEPGAYSEKAAYELLGSNITAVGLNSFDDCFHAVQSNTATYAVLPIENSLGGSIHANYDLQLRHDLHIIAELDFRVRHCLLALPGVKKEDLKIAMSHPQALAQCDLYLRNANIKPNAAYDTAGSAKIIQEQQLKDTCAIASDLAAKHYGLEVLDEGIEDDNRNFTRFIVLSKEDWIAPLPSPNPMKTSIVFTLMNSPGVLFKALACFSLRDVDLTKIESRPDKLGLKGWKFPSFITDSTDSKSSMVRPLKLNKMTTSQRFLDSELSVSGDNDNPDAVKFRYMFYVDCNASLLHENVQHAIRNLAEIAPFIRILGCYPKDAILTGSVADNVGVAQNTKAIDCSLPVKVTQPVQQETVSPSDMNVDKKLRIGIIGFGNFGQFLAKEFAKQHTVYATSRSDYTATAKEIGVTFYSGNDYEGMFGNNLDCVVLSMSILSFESVLKSIPYHLLNNVLIVDVLSVKMQPKNVLLDFLPMNCDVLCTHPMFGPESGKNGWDGLPFVYEKVRVTVYDRCNYFLKIFEAAACHMIEMSCEEHDRISAGSQFVTHFTGRMLSRLNMKSTSINTKGFETLLALVENTCSDSFDLFYALYDCNPNSARQVEELKRAMRSLVDELNRSSRRMSSDGSHPQQPGEIRLSELIQKVGESKTGKVHALAMKLKAEGRDMITTLAVGEPDFAPPELILKAAEHALYHGHTRYTAVVGTMELRQAISKYLGTKGVAVDAVSEVLITSGGKQAIYNLLHVLCEGGDEVIVPAPFWVSYPEIVRLSGATPVIVHRSADNGYHMTPEQLEAAITPQTRLLILCNPCNPTGAVYNRAQLEAFAAVLRKPQHDHVFVLADEIYEMLTYGVEHVSFASLDGMLSRTFIVNGFAKGFAMTGFRVGYLTGPARVVKAALTLQSQLNSCACSVSQYAATKAFDVPPDVLAPLYAEMQRKRDFMVRELSKIEHITCPKPDGAFYVFPDVSHYFTLKQEVTTSTELCTYLIEKFGLALVAGDAFGYPNGVRFSYATSMQDLEQAVRRFSDGLKSLL